jgi:hypothetical protein
MVKRKRRQRTSSNKQKLKKQLQANPAFKDLEIVEPPAGQEKMSAVLLRFVEPYRDLVPPKQAFERLIIFAMVAWNASLLEGDARQELVGLFKATLTPDNDQEWQPDIEQLLAKLMRLEHEPRLCDG